MGARMARRLLDAGYTLTVYNRSKDACAALEASGAMVATSPRTAAEGNDVVIACIRDDDAARAIWMEPKDGALAAMGSGQTAIESSTLTPACVKELAQATEARSASFLEAPVVGSRPQAESGKLVHLVGGEASTLASVCAVLAVLGSTQHHVGTVGQGAVLKLIVNALLGIQVAALGEFLPFAEKAGISAEATLAILRSLPVTSPALGGLGTLMLVDEHTPMFPIELVAKDLRYATEAAHAVNARLPTTTAAADVYAGAAVDGLGKLNLTGVTRWIADQH